MEAIKMLANIFDDFVMLIAAVGILLLTTLIVIRRTRPRPGRNPFSTRFMRDAESLEIDQVKRNKVLKQRFRVDKIPQELDAIVIGSGIGGLSAAVLLSRAGKKVLVLEQHDQAGGCCHTFVDKGYEFDTGIHYIGKMKAGTETRILMDFLTDGQLDWAPMDDQYDIVAIGPPDRAKRYPMVAGRKHYVENLKKLFPNDTDTVDKFIKILDETRGAMLGLILPKIFPKWVVRILLKTGLFNKMFPTFQKYARMTLGQALDNITDNTELKAVLAYAYGDLGPIPAEFSLPIYCSLINHYIPGAFYPVGGPSEIPFLMIPIIQSHGGQVLVDARVSRILTDARGRVTGVRVTRNGRDIDISADMVISDAGVANTFRNLLPLEVAAPTALYKIAEVVGPSTGCITVFAGLEALYKIAEDVGPSTGCITVFAGLEGNKEELDLPASNIWAFLSPDLDKDMQTYGSLAEDVAADKFAPALFIGFPSAKDPAWESRYPGKSTCAIVAFCPPLWFQEWADKRVKHRGYEYESLKKAMGQSIWRQCEMLFPQLVGKLDYFDVGTPVSNRFYLGCPHGEVCGLDHVKKRVKPEVIMELRPETEVPGLYLTGQDIFTGGFAGGLYGGLLCASSILHRNLLTDLQSHARTVRKKGAGCTQ